MFETETEAWTAVAETLEMTGEMPVRWVVEGVEDKCPGLCSMIRRMANDGVISDHLYEMMGTRITNELDKRNSAARREYLDQPWKVGPRIKIARKFAEESKS